VWPYVTHVLRPDAPSLQPWRPSQARWRWRRRRCPRTSTSPPAERGETHPSPPLLQRARGVDALASAAGRAGGEGGSIARTLCASCSAAAGGQTEIITYGMRWSLAAKHHHGKCPEGGMQREDACNSRRVVPRPAQPARRLNLHPPVPGPPPARASLHSGPPTPRARARRSCAGCSRSRRPSSLGAIVPRHARHQHRSAWPASVKLRCCC
jgi:hypothetical protein